MRFTPRTSLFPPARARTCPSACARPLAALVLAVTATLAHAAPQQTGPQQSVLVAAQAAKGDAVGLLERLVNIDSGTANGPGIGQVSAIVTAQLQALGAQIETHPAAPAQGSNIVATWRGSGKTNILMMAHMDTVFKDGFAKDHPFRVSGAHGYGPGIMDDKGGIVMALYALKILQQLHFQHYGRITLLLNTNEETGSAGSRALIQQLARENDVTLNLEPGRVADGLVIWRKGSGEVTLDIKGKAAHAGVAPELGRNALMEAAHQMLQLSKLGDPAKQTTINFTVLKTGEATNVIPDHVVAYADVRVAVPEEFDRIEKDLNRVAQDKLIPDTQVGISMTRGFPPMPKNAATDALAATAQRIYGELGKQLTLEGTGGAADASLSAAAGTPTLDALGIVGGGIHTPDEYAELDSIVPRLYLLSRLLMETGAGTK
jgi:glutamate carboxypeptidase